MLPIGVLLGLLLKVSPMQGPERGRAAPSLKSAKSYNTKNLEGFDAHFLHLPGTESGCRCCGAFGALWTDRWLGSCGNRSGSAAVAGARWGLEAGGISANKMNQIKSKNYASSSSKCFIVKSKQTSKMCLDYTIAAEGLGEYQTLLHYQSYAGAVIWGVKL